MTNKWYASGLRFECIGCGNCCAGPEEGDIWISPAEIEMLAEHLSLTENEVRVKYTRRGLFRTSIIEDKATCDCIFLTPCVEGKRGCAIYPVRPNQCRTWPFWNWNLTTRRDWEEAARRCPGMNHGREYAFEEIEVLRTQKQWWERSN